MTPGQMICRIPPGRIGNTATPARARVQSESRAAQVLEFCTERGVHVIVEIAASKPEWLDEFNRIAEASAEGPKSRTECRLLAKMQRKRRQLR